MSEYRVSRWVRGFDRVGDELVVEYRLPDGVSLAFLRRLLAADADDPMYHCYPLNADQLKTLSSILENGISEQDLDFFLEADAEK